MSPSQDHVGAEVTVPSIRETVQELASGAVYRLSDDGDPELLREIRQPEGGVFEVLIHRGWLYSRNGYCGLTDAGLQAYLRSTDELGDGQLLHPHEWRN